MNTYAGVEDGLPAGDTQPEAAAIGFLPPEILALVFLRALGISPSLFPPSHVSTSAWLRLLPLARGGVVDGLALDLHRPRPPTKCLFRPTVTFI